MKFVEAKLNKDRIAIKKESYDTIKKQLSQVKLIAQYEDGSQKQYGIKWKDDDLDAILQTATSGKIRGQAIFPEYGDVLVAERADPYVLLAEDGYYYFTASYPVRGNEENKVGIGYDRIVLRRAKTIQGLSDAEEIAIWHQKDSKRLNRYIWAPELHKIGDSYYVIFTGSIEPDNVWRIRPHMLKCVGEDLMDPSSWYTKDESNLYPLTAGCKSVLLEGDCDPFSDFSLDMTCFENKGRWYVIWAQIGPDHMSDLFLSEVDPEKPWEIITPPMLLTSPEYDWEMRGGVKVDEGPFVLKHENKLWVSFSASATDYTYCVSFLTADMDADLLNKNSWEKFDHPFLTSDDFEDQCGPGHNSFTTDENGNVVLIYHARPFACSNAQDANGNYGRCEYVEPGQNPLSDPCRHARAKSVQFDAAGLPVLNMSAQEELPIKNREVELWITIE